MAGPAQRNRRRRRRAKVEVEPEPEPAAQPADDSPSPAKTSSSSSSAGSTDRATRCKTPHSRLYSQPELGGDDDDEQLDTRAVRRKLFSLIHRYYLDAVSRLPPAQLRGDLARGLLLGGHCFGPLHPVHNVIVNSIWYAAAFPHHQYRHGDNDDDNDGHHHQVLSTDGIARICQRSLQGLVASLRHYCPFLSAADALYYLMDADADLAAATALANGTSKSSALQAMASRHLLALHLAAEAARHPNPTAFAHFASSLRTTANVGCGTVPFLLIKHVLSAGDIHHLSTVLVPAMPPYQPPQSLPLLSPRLLDHISSQKKQIKDTARQVLALVDMASQRYASQTGEHLILHSVCGVSLLHDQGLKNRYHINFLAYREDSGSAVGIPVLLFTEAILLACDETDICLCVPVDPATEIGCCFPCETNKKKIVHPTYDDYLGCRDFEEDEVDCGSNFLEPLDVDYIFFDADRDRALANYLDGRIGCDSIGTPNV